MTTITKGTQVYTFGIYSDKGTAVFHRFTVGSWGKKQGHLINGKGTCAEMRVYTDRCLTSLNGLPPSVVAVADCADPIAYTLAFAAAQVAKQQAHYAERLSRTDWCANAGYKAAMEADLAALHEPRALDGDDKVAMDAEYAAWKSAR